jgi:trehalose synthase
MLELLSDPELAAERARSGRERVREHFLLPRLLMEELRLLRALDTDGASSVSRSAAEA